MSGARLRRVRGTLAAVVVGVLAALTLSTGAAQAAELSPEGEEAFADVAACAAEADHLLAAIVVDQSGSLRQTDRADQRVGAILTALDALEQLGASSAGALDVQANLATFGQRYEELVGWGNVSGTHSEALRSATSSQLPDRDRDNFTDYRAALGGAHQSLNARAASLEGTSCKVVLWFTDGRLDVDGAGGGGAATDQARAEMCAPQGLVDGLRGDGVTVIALALFTAGGGGSVTDQDRERLKAVAEGAGAGETCGTVPIPASASTGAYLPADDAGAMRRLFAQAAALIEGATSGGSFVCPDDTCIDGRLEIPTDRGIGRFRLVLERAPGSPIPQLLDHDGEPVDISPGQRTVGDVAVSVTDRDGLTVVDVTFGGSGAPGGEWTLVADASLTTLVDLYYFWGVTLRIDAPDGLVVGEEGAIEVTPVHADGSPVDPDEVDGLELTVTVDGTPVAAEQQDDGTWLAPLSIPASEVPPSVRVEATARAVSAPSGIELGPVSGSAELSTSFPPSFPTLSPTRLELPAIVGDGESAGTLTFTGSDRGATRACFADAQVSAPELAGLVTVTPETPCVDIPAGAQVDVRVAVAPEGAADGLVNGTIPVSLEGVDAGEPITVEVPFELAMSRPVDEATRWGLVALFTAIAVALAWATAVISRRIADRYALTTDARVASVPVVASAAGVRRTDHPERALLDPAFDFHPIGVDRARRASRFEAGGLQYGRSFPFFPLAAGRAWVADHAGGVAVVPGGHQPMLDRRGTRAPVEFPGTVGFVFVAEAKDDGTTDDALRGRLVMLVDARDGVAAELPDRLDEVTTASWDRIVEAAGGALDARAGTAGAAGKASRTPAPAGVAASTERSEPSDGIPQLPDWMSDDALSSSVPPRMPGGGDWADPATTQLPAAEPERRRSPFRRKGSAPDPAPAPRPSAEDDGPPPPPPTVNFWD